MELSTDQLHAVAQLSTPALVAFRVVAEELHFGRAATRLSVNQSHVSRLVQQFEQRVGVTAFERTTRLVRLTAEGERILALVDAALVALVGVTSFGAVDRVVDLNRATAHSPADSSAAAQWRRY